MTFLPIAERELRVASRKPSTFRLRVIAALVALVIGAGFFVLAELPTGVPFGTSLGKGLFATLTWLSLAGVLSAGLFFTSDCLSEEKREGTIGFLFLTDLRGYDVVFGKLLATSLRGFCALMAIFPILAITLLMGGVTGAQFWKTILALVNALFVSLAAGLFVSAISRDSQKALVATFLLLLLIAAGGPVTDSIVAGARGASFTPVFSFSSPVFLFVTAIAWAQPLFWPGFLANQAAAWMLLALTCLLLPRTWQERIGSNSVLRGNRAYDWKFGTVARRLKTRRKLLDLNPVLWLACRERWQGALLWVLTILLVSGLIATFLDDPQSWSRYAWSYLASPFILLFYLGVASMAGRLFVAAQRNGLMELLLATPLTTAQIVQGQWRGLLRMFGFPLVLCLAAHFLGGFLSHQATSRQMSAAMNTAATATATTTNGSVTVRRVSSVTVSAQGTSTNIIAVNASPKVPPIIVTGAWALTGTITVTANLVALAWFGMWMGLTSNRTNLATLKTIAFVQIIPWFVISFVSAMLVPIFLLPGLMRGVGTSPGMMVWWPLLTSVLASTLYLIKDALFWAWARRKLYSELRERAVRFLAPIHSPLPPPLPAAAPLPPIIPSS